jgi:hypothetical protein
VLHECQQIVAAKSPLVPAADAKTWERAGISPPTQRRFADVEEASRFADIEQIVCVGHAENYLRGFTG